ncbi:hypothetical protein D3C76_1484030 [compost metagenome]
MFKFDHLQENNSFSIHEVTPLFRYVMQQSHRLKDTPLHALTRFQRIYALAPRDPEIEQVIPAATYTAHIA